MTNSRCARTRFSGCVLKNVAPWPWKTERAFASGILEDDIDKILYPSRTAGLNILKLAQLDST